MSFQTVFYYGYCIHGCTVSPAKHHWYCIDTQLFFDIAYCMVIKYVLPNALTAEVAWLCNLSSVKSSLSSWSWSIKAMDIQVFTSFSALFLCLHVTLRMDWQLTAERNVLRILSVMEWTWAKITYLHDKVLWKTSFVVELMKFSSNTNNIDQTSFLVAESKSLLLILKKKWIKTLQQNGLHHFGNEIPAVLVGHWTRFSHFMKH